MKELKKVLEGKDKRYFKRKERKMNKTVFFSVLTLCVTVLIMYSVDKVTLSSDIKNQREDYARCIREAKTNYNNQWAYKCKQLKEPEDCGLNTLVAGILDEKLSKDKQECLNIYKEKAYLGE